MLNESTQFTPFFGSRKWIPVLVLGMLIAVALGIRLYKLYNPPLDFHPTRQLQSMIKARGMYYQQVKIQPEWKRQFGINVGKGMPTEEPEIVENLAAVAYRIAGGDLLWLPRLFSILFWLIGGFWLYLLLREMVNVDGALIGTAFYLFVPYGGIASRSFQPDPLNVLLIILALWGIVRWIKNPNWKWAVTAGLLAGIAIYSKVTAGFFIAGGFGGIILGSMGIKRAVRNPKTWLIVALSILPVLVYHLFGFYIFNFLGRMTSLRIFPKLLLDMFFYQSWANKIDLVVGIGALILALLGTFLYSSLKGKAFMIGLWASYLIYGAVFAYYFQSHDYYHLPLIPIVAIGMAPLAEVVMKRLQETWQGPKWLKYGIVLAIFVFGIGFNVREVQNTLRRVDYRPSISKMDKIGAALNHDGSKTIAITQDYGMRLQYWAFVTTDYWFSAGDFKMRELAGQRIDVDEMFKEKTEGKDYFLVTDFTELDRQPHVKKMLQDQYPIIQRGDGFMIYDLRNRK